MYQNRAGRYYPQPSSEILKYYKEQLSKLDPNKTSDTATYIDLKTTLDTYELMNRYQEGSWQMNIVYDYLQGYIKQINGLIYGPEKDEIALEKVQKQYDTMIEKMDSDDWKYFAKEEQKELEEQIAVAQKQKEATVDKKEIQEIENNLYYLQVRKQVNDWRLEKEISYADGYFNEALKNYSDYKTMIISYEQQEKHEYEEQLDYQRALKKAEIARYSIENGVEAGKFNNNRGILMAFYNEFEILIIMMIIMIAAGIVSDEFSKGTIKLLLVRPYKRTKILMAKFLSCVIILMITILILIGMQYLVGGIVYGFDSTQIPALVYHYDTHQLESMSLINYIGMTTLAKLPMFILLMAVAFVCSTVFNNTAVAVVIPFLGYIGAPILLELAKAYNISLLRYFPTLNWDLTSYLWGGLPEFQYINLGFSIFMSVFYLIGILIPTFIIFKKENIKNG